MGTIVIGDMLAPAVLEGAAREAEQLDCAARTVGSAFVHAARPADGVLVMVATTGRSMRACATPGSTTHLVLRPAGCPIAVARRRATI
jgi:hypothetical protein